MNSYSQLIPLLTFYNNKDSIFVITVKTLTIYQLHQNNPTTDNPL